MRNLLLLLLTIISIKTTVQAQNICELLDTAYIDFCRHKDPENKLVFLKNFSFKWDHYSIEDNHETIILKERRKLFYKFFGKRDYRGRREQTWNLKPGTEFIDHPSVFIQGDSIIIMNHTASVGRFGSFYFGASYMSLFTFDGKTNRWKYNKGWRPDLEFRSATILDSLVNRSSELALEKIETLFEETSPITYMIADYFPTDNKSIKLFVPNGESPSRYRYKADFFVGFPEVELQGKEIIIKLKIIKSKHIKNKTSSNIIQTVVLRQTIDHISN